MDGSQMDAVTQRLDRLERENGRWKAVGIIAVAVFALVVSLGATGGGGAKVAEEIRAKKFAVVDEDGRERGVFAVTEMGSGLQLKDVEGRVRAVLMLDAKGPGLELRDAKGRARTRLGLTRDGQRVVRGNVSRSIFRSSR
ncbi:MAG: hypothetical protein ACE5JS_01315 [Nitrospinota bacterium]